MAQQGLGGGRAVFKIRDFNLYISSRFLWGIGQHILNIAVAWIVYDLTRDPLSLGLIGLFAFVPAVPFALIAGPIIDRYDRRAIVILCNAGMAVTSLTMLTLLTAGYINPDRTWPLYVAVLVFGAARSFSGPAGQAFVMSLIPREQFTSAAAWNNTLNQGATILGPSIGGLLIPFGTAVPFAVSFLAHLVATILALLIVPRPIEGGKAPVSWGALVAGYKFIGKAPVILGAITLDLVAVFLAGATALLPIFTQEIFETGPWGLGVLRSMPSVGALCAALILANFSLRWHIGRTMIGAVTIYGLATIGFGLSPNFFVGLFFLFILGAADMFSVVIRQTLIQIETPDTMRGRVLAIHSLLSGTSNHLGQFQSGALASFIGTVPTVLVGGMGAVIASIVWMRVFPSLSGRRSF